MHAAKTRHHWLYAGYFVLSLIYYEIVFHISCSGNPFNLGLLYKLLFCAAYSSLGYYLSSLFRKQKYNRIIAAVLLFATSMAYIVQYLVFKQFKMFYDINTMTGGAGDALSTYVKEIIDLIFLQGGFVVILLLLLPTIIYLLLNIKYDYAPRSYPRQRFLVLCLSILSYALAVLMIMLHPVHSLTYHEQYNYQAAVPQFGLISAMRLDLQDQIFGNDYEFEFTPPPETTLPDESDPSAQVTNPDPTATEDSATESTEPVIEYGYNQLDIDFAALMESGNYTEASLDSYVSSLTASKQNEFTGLFEGKNLIFISAEAFSREVIDPELTPTLYRMATKGIQFTDFYQPSGAGTTGGEYQNIFGMLPTQGGMSFKRKADDYNYYTMGTQLDLLGYYGKAFHNNDYTFYDRHRTHIALGYSDGFMGYGNGMEEYVQNFWPQSDYEMVSGTFPTYVDQQPFNIYYMSVSGHNNYQPGSNAMTKRHWDRVQELPYSSRVKGYIAANLEMEDAMTYLIGALEEAGIADDTVICIVPDHFPYGLDSEVLGDMPYLSELYGYDVDTTWERDHSVWLLWSGCLEDMEPIVVDSPTSSLDVLPTLMNLFGVEFDSRLLPGRDVFSDAEAIVFNMSYDWVTDLGTYYAAYGKFVPAIEGNTVPQGYIDRIQAIVKNKVTYCEGVLDCDYFRHVFDEE